MISLWLTHVFAVLWNQEPWFVCASAWVYVQPPGILLGPESLLDMKQIAERSVSAGLVCSIHAAGGFASTQQIQVRKWFSNKCSPEVVAQPCEKYWSVLTRICTFIWDNPHPSRKRLISPFFLLWIYGPKPQVSPNLVTSVQSHIYHSDTAWPLV